MAHNKQDLINHVALQTKLSKEQTQEAVEAVFSGMTHLLKQGEELRIRGFGAFVVQDVPQRQGRNPRTGEQIQIAARKRVTFKSGAELKEAFNTKEATNAKDKSKIQKKTSTADSKKNVTKNQSQKK